VGPAMDRDFNFSSCIHCGQCVIVCPTGALHEKHNITEVQEYLNKPDIIKVIQYSPLVTAGIAEEMGMRYTRDFDRILNSVLRRIGFDKVFTTGTGSDLCITEIAGQLSARIEQKSDTPLYISVCPAWVKYAEQFLPSLIPHISTVKSPQQITGALVKTLVAEQSGVKPEQIFSVSATPCMAMKFEARRDGMMRKGISDVDSVLTVRELARLIRLYGIDITNIEGEPADEPLSGRSSSAVLAEVSGGMAEGVLRLFYYQRMKKEADKQSFKKMRSTGTFREASVEVGDLEIKVAIVDGLTGLEKLKSAMASGKKYDLVEVMTCPGGCVHGAGLSFTATKDEIKSRAKLVYHIDETEAINLPCKSPVLLHLYDNLIKANTDIADRNIFFTRFEKRNVLL
jgi:iron-only hydrogenase group A